MMGTALLAVGAGFFLISLHPFIFYPFTLKLLLRWLPRPVMPGVRPDAGPTTVAICLCAFNEAPVIEAKIENLLALRASVPNLEILIYVDGSTDGTDRLVARFGDRVRTVLSEARHGKTFGMNLLVNSTTAQIIVFTDANVLFEQDALTHLLQPFADPGIGCVLGHLEYITREGSATASTGSMYWRMEERLKQLETQTGSAITADGAIYAIRRALHVSPPLTVADDIYISMSVMCAGYRVVRARDAVAYEDMVADPRQEFARKIRIGCLAFTAHRLLWPKLRQLPAIELYKYLSHKVIRWFTIYFLVASVIFVLSGIGFSWGPSAMGAAAMLGLAGMAIVSITPSGPLGQLGSIIKAFLATGVGVWYSYRGPRFQTWVSPARAVTPMPAAINPHECAPNQFERS